MSGPPPEDPRDPTDDETVVVPPDASVDETVVRDEWGAETVVPSPADEAVVVEETETEPPRRKPPTLWPWLLALLVLVLAGLAAAYFFTRDDDEQAAATTSATTTGAELVSVPDVVGTTSSQATETLRNTGFDVNLVSVPSDRAPGTVVAQAPPAGSEQPEGSTIRLNVAEASTGTTTGTTTSQTTTAPATTAPPPQPSPATVPDVVGQELAEAGGAFADEGLKSSVAYVPSQEAFGRVVAQAQPAGTELESGDTVQLNVSTGPDPADKVTVPRATGQSLADGRDALEEAGFEVLALTIGDGEIRNESTISSQSPSGGASVPRGSLVLVYV